ncbi:hypothetical protein EVAR_75749_1 [Eumeta japonica]|uniref:Uncharacterized protein n=1 Tax=Eumeta variegata TaxID=151549 RepID=A0A4C1TDT9_EUMVA|nr:hypothetical protein EVAR_75749_1 [Eumeta japonica]
MKTSLFCTETCKHLARGSDTGDDVTRCIISRAIVSDAPMRVRLSRDRGRDWPSARYFDPASIHLRFIR